MRAAKPLSVILLVLTAGLAGCATGGNPSHSPSPADSSITAVSPEEMRCADALSRLDVLIASSDLVSASPSPALVEARALRRGAVELMASGDFDLALDLIESAIALFEKGEE